MNSEAISLNSLWLSGPVCGTRSPAISLMKSETVLSALVSELGRGPYQVDETKRIRNSCFWALQALLLQACIYARCCKKKGVRIQREGASLPGLQAGQEDGPAPCVDGR